VQVDEVDTSLKLKFPPAARSGQYPVIVKDLSKSYGDHASFSKMPILLLKEVKSRCGKMVKENLR
jgi:ATP-binding cassette subfamily F protein 3